MKDIRGQVRIDRRQMLSGLAMAAGTMLGSRAALAEDFVDLPFGNGRRPLVAFPQKQPLILLTTRPPQLETPIRLLHGGGFTANDAFFVRYHLGTAPPLGLDGNKHEITITGAVETPLRLTMRALRTEFDAVEINAVLQCSGNGRGLFVPRVPGGQLYNGAMGNARWRGVPLRAVLDRAGIKAGAVQVAFNGVEDPVLPATPDFSKAIDIAHATDGEVMLAYAMNGEDLPLLNGFPIRLVVPGHYGTYWVKHLSQITVLDKPFDGYWVKTAYRIPATDCACVPIGEKPAATVLIARYNIRSLITSVEDGQRVSTGGQTLKGIAFDGGNGIAEVRVSSDGGASWQPCILGEDLGRYSFREWRCDIHLAAGPHVLMARAVSRSGEIQPLEQRWNPMGYMRNMVEPVHVVAA
jgi:sulfite dehydrogenase (cytochrome) subunit A